MSARGASYTLVEGQCACGHVGLQKQPDICGPCAKEEKVRERDRVKAREHCKKSYRAKKITELFQLLPYDYQLSLIERLSKLAKAP